MIVKTVKDKNRNAKWYECDKIEWFPKTNDSEQQFVLYVKKVEVAVIILKDDIQEDDGITIYIMENGKTVDTLYWKN